MWARHLLFLVLLAGGAFALVKVLFPQVTPAPARAQAPAAVQAADFGAAVERVDAAFSKVWQAHKLQVAPPAPELAVARRLALGLMGTIPSLQEVRQFEAKSGDRLQGWLDTILDDPRFHAYFAERLARAYVGTEGGPFIIFRRRRFVSWLTEQVQHNRPYDQVVRELIESKGLWTDKPAVNFLTVTVEEANKNQPNPDRLAGRVARAFLGQRIDCAQCHDDRSEPPKWKPWKRRDFWALAAFFGQTRNGGTGIHDDSTGFYEAELRSGKRIPVEPAVPDQGDLLPDEGTLRHRLAIWVTHRQNRFFAPATVNRVWAVLCGRPLVDPIDDLDLNNLPATLQVLSEDFVAHDYDLRRLIRIITATRAFRLDSAADHDLTPEHVSAWAAFPLQPLRPEQMAGAVLQAARVTTNDHSSSTFLQFVRGQQTSDFVQRYGDPGEDEFRAHSCTIPQVLLVMNGDLVEEHTRQALFNAATRIGWQAPDDAAAVEAAFLTCLTRRPSPSVAKHFEERLGGTKGEERSRLMADLFWALINSTEFGTQH
jgi:hypothetical protein